jgi:hypothetical protein
MNLGEAAMFLAVGFVPTLIALEMVYRTGRAIGRRGEISSLAQHNSKLSYLHKKRERLVPLNLSDTYSKSNSK